MKYILKIKNNATVKVLCYKNDFIYYVCSTPIVYKQRRLYLF